MCFFSHSRIFFLCLRYLNKFDFYQELPGDFVKFYSNSMNMDVRLQVNDGTPWPIGLSAHNGKLLFDIGWNEFCHAYGLERGYILRFKYIGHSFFKVVLKDRKTTQLFFPGDENRVHYGYVGRNLNILNDGPVDSDGYGTNSVEQYMNFFPSESSSTSNKTTTKG